MTTWMLLWKMPENRSVYKKEATCLLSCAVSVLLIRNRKQHGQFKQHFRLLTKLRAAVIAVGDFLSLCYKPDCSDNIRIYLDVIRLCSGSAPNRQYCHVCYLLQQAVWGQYYYTELYSCPCTVPVLDAAIKPLSFLKVWESL